MNPQEQPNTPGTIPKPLYDFSGLGKLAKDVEFVRELQQMFIKRAPKQVAQLWTAVEVADWQTVLQVAHSLKSTLGTIGSEQSAALLEQLENSVRQGQAKEQLKASLTTVAGTVEAVVQAFEQELNPAA
ncbi:MAG TPA: Hpt domain-containing protein [Hymenobacter sp.]|jgi:HPt (histidine-containing phosphotransfer) domain-containing protein